MKRGIDDWKSLPGEKSTVEGVLVGTTNMEVAFKCLRGPSTEALYVIFKYTVVSSVLRSTSTRAVAGVILVVLTAYLLKART